MGIIFVVHFFRKLIEIIQKIKRFGLFYIRERRILFLAKIKFCIIYYIE